MDKLAKTGADVQYTTAERGEKCNGANFNRVKINLEIRKRSTIEIERDNGPSVRSLAFAPPQMTSRHAEKADMQTKDEEGKCRQPEPDHYRPDKGRGQGAAGIPHQIPDEHGATSGNESRPPGTTTSNNQRPFVAIRPEVSAAIFAARPFESSLPSQR